MNVRVIDAMDDATVWSAVGPDGGSPSTEVTVSAHPADEPPSVGPDVTDGRAGVVVTASEAAAGHALRRTLDRVDITDMLELCLWVRVPRTPAVPSRFVLELRLGSAARPVESSPGAWHRLVPVAVPGSWERVCFSLDDLPADVAEAVTTVQLRCVTAPLVVHLDDLAAVSARSMLHECDLALAAAFGKVTVGDRQVALSFGPVAEATPAPGIEVRQVDARYAPRRVVDVPARRDYTALGFREVTAGTPFDLDYAITPVASTREEQAQLLDALLERLPPVGELVADGERYPIELLSPAGSDRPGGALGDEPVLVYRLGVRAPGRVGPPVREVQQVAVSTDLVVTL